MTRRFHIPLLVACCALFCAVLCTCRGTYAALSPARTVRIAQAAETAPAARAETPEATPAATLAAPSAAAWLCERACNSDLDLPRPACTASPQQVARARTPHPGSASVPSHHFRTEHAAGMSRATAYRSTSDSRTPSVADTPVRLRRLLI